MACSKSQPIQKDAYLFGSGKDVTGKNKKGTY